MPQSRTSRANRFLSELQSDLFPDLTKVQERASVWLALFVRSFHLQITGINDDGDGNPQANLTALISILHDYYFQAESHYTLYNTTVNQRESMNITETSPLKVTVVNKKKLLTDLSWIILISDKQWRTRCV